MLLQVLGNHDFDGGVDHVVSFLRKTNTSVILSNVDVSGEPSWPKNNLFYQWFILTVGGEKVGLCGYMLKNTPRYNKQSTNKQDILYNSSYYLLLLLVTIIDFSV